jgi:F0F1-type ATP synthase assembly protein I
MQGQDHDGRDSSGRRHERQALGQALQLGYNLTVGMAVFALLGYYVDRRRGGGAFWTICGMFIGLLYGAYEVWKAVRDLNAKDGKPSRAGQKEGNTERSPPGVESGTDGHNARPAEIRRPREE